MASLKLLPQEGFRIWAFYALEATEVSGDGLEFCKYEGPWSSKVS